MIKLVGTRATLEISPTVWTMSLEIARLCGWQPAVREQSLVTVGGADAQNDPIRMLEWQTKYLASDGQLVTSEDASHFAIALESAVTGTLVAVEDWVAGRLAVTERIRTPASGFRFFTTPMGRDQLRSIAKFARHGAFRIQ